MNCQHYQHRHHRLAHLAIALASVACLAATASAIPDSPKRRAEPPARSIIELLIVVGTTERSVDPIADGELVPQLDGTIILRGEEVEDSGSTLAWEVTAPAQLVNDELVRRAAMRRRQPAVTGSARPPVMMAAAQQQVINFTMTATNNSAFTKYFGASDKLATSTIGPALYGGTVVGAVTDTSAVPNGATFSTPFDSSYRLWIDQVLWFTMLDDPSSAAATAGGTATIGPETFGNPIPSTPGPAILSVIELELQCFVTAGDTVTITGIACFQ